VDRHIEELARARAVADLDQAAISGDRRAELRRRRLAEPGLSYAAFNRRYRERARSGALRYRAQDERGSLVEVTVSRPERNGRADRVDDRRPLPTDELQSSAVAESSPYLTATADAYDAVADLYADFVRDSLDRLPLDRAILAVFAELVRAAGPRPVAEARCGPGHMTAHLRNLGLDAFGIDLSSELIDIVRIDHPDLRFEVGSMGAFDVADGELGGLLSWYSVIHIPPPELPPYFAGFRRALASFPASPPAVSCCPPSAACWKGWGTSSKSRVQ
jgi:hypothetical protein